MKTQTNPLAALVVALLTVLAPASWAQGVITRFDLFAGVVNRQASPAEINAILTSIGAGNPQAAPWQYVPNGSTINLSNLFHQGPVGSGTRVAGAIDSLSPFSLSQLVGTLEDPMFGQSSISFASYSNFGVGINRGPDNILGTADDITYTTGNANTPVHAIRFIGVGYSIEIGNSSIPNALNTWAPITDLKVTYSLFNETRENRINFGVPEPSCGALVLLGLIGLRGLKNRK